MILLKTAIVNSFTRNYRAALRNVRVYVLWSVQLFLILFLTTFLSEIVFEINDMKFEVNGYLFIVS